MSTRTLPAKPALVISRASGRRAGSIDAGCRREAIAPSVWRPSPARATGARGGGAPASAAAWARTTSGVRSVQESSATRKRTPVCGQASRYARSVRSIRSSSLCAGITMSRRTQTSLVWVDRWTGWDLRCCARANGPARRSGATRAGAFGERFRARRLDYPNTESREGFAAVTPVTRATPQLGGSADRAAHFAERHAPGATSQDHGVAVLEERALAAVGEPQRVAPVPRQLDQAAHRAGLRARDRARGEQVAGPRRRAVDGRVGELLRERPVQAAGVGPRDDRAVQLDLELDVQRPVSLRAQVRERLG